MNVRVRCVATDSIYANNANRKFCTKYGISTSFVRKGRAAKNEPLRKVLRSELSKERATRLEGSFGTQKQHYLLARIKARNRKTEIPVSYTHLDVYKRQPLITSHLTYHKELLFLVSCHSHLFFLYLCKMIMSNKKLR